MFPRQLKHSSAQTAEIVLTEYPGWPRFEVEAYRLDGAFILLATDDFEAAESVYLQASLSL
jgi:hypothetical protein